MQLLDEEIFTYSLFMKKRNEIKKRYARGESIINDGSLFIYGMKP
jgi:hypothetical protein